MSGKQNIEPRAKEPRAESISNGRGLSVYLKRNVFGFFVQKGEKMQETTENTRLLNNAQAQYYTGMGEKRLRAWCDSIGATVRNGRKRLYDKAVIDAAITERKGLA